MYLMIADEANPEQTDPNKFFVYGGVFFDVDKIYDVHNWVEAIREKFEMKPGESLKFATRPLPKSLSPAEHTEIKEKIIKEAPGFGIEICVYSILHAIARNKSHTELVQWGSNILLGKFNQFLSERNSFGWSIFDRVNTEKPYKYLQDKFASRDTSTPRPQRLEKVVGYGFTCDGASHLCSVADILIGGMRYVINEPERDIAGRSIMKNLAPLLWCNVSENGVRNVGGRGLVQRPKEVSHPGYQADYQEIRDRIALWANE